MMLEFYWEMLLLVLLFMVFLLICCISYIEVGIGIMIMYGEPLYLLNYLNKIILYNIGIIRNNMNHLTNKIKRKVV
jgi:hypothetical protein